jgi:outer membrane protein assembly factor BamB
MPGPPQDDPTDYFTSFEQTGSSFFLSYIPWIYNRPVVMAAPVQQASGIALSGTYSCRLYEDLIGASSLETNNLPIPPGSASAMLSGWFRAGLGGQQVEVHLSIDGNDSVTQWRFANADVGAWVYRSASVVVPQGAQIFYGWIRLVTDTPLTSNQIWLDDFAADFVLTLAPQLQNIIVGDIGGNTYALDLAQGTQKWRASVGSGIIGWAPAIANGIAYFATSGRTGRLTALNTRTGAQIWSQTLSAGVRAQPQVYGGSCVVCGSDGYLRAYAVTNGVLQWQLNVLQLPAGQQAAMNGTLLAGNLLAVTTDRGVALINLDSQAVVWTALATLSFSYPPEVGGGMVFAGAQNGIFYAFDLISGAQRWSYQTGGAVQSQPQFVNQLVMFGSDDGNMYGLNAQSGAWIWTLPIPDAAAVRSFLYSNGLLFVASNAIGGGAYCYSIAINQGTWTFSQKWRVPLTNGAQADPAVYGEQVFFTGSASTVLALDMRTGAQAWAFTPSRVAFAGPALVIPAPQFDQSRRFDQVCWLGTHNAFANSDDGWWYAQQSSTILAQLDDGVRLLLLDVWNCPSGGSDRLVYAHEGCALSYLLLPFSAYVQFSDSLGQIRRWLDSNPSEIVTLYLQQRIGARSSALIAAALASAGIGSYIFYADRPNTGPNGTWNVGTQGWPTLGWMIAAGKRLVIFSDWQKFTPNFGNDGLPYVWQWCVENDFGTASSNGQCNNRGGSQPISNNPPALFMMNYSSDFSANRANELDGSPYYIFDDYNDFNKIMGIVNGCFALRSNRLPNFLAVDWYEFGRDGGPKKAVEEINARWSTTVASERMSANG